MNYIIAHAKAFAEHLHATQSYGHHPYAYHLEQVVDILKLAGYSSPHLDCDIIAAGWLHDSIEDTPYTWARCVQDFGPDVADIVQAVTDEPGANRRERHEKTYPKIKASEKATAVKLADRIANVLESMRNNSPTLKMYQKEHPGFQAGVRRESYKDVRVTFLWTLLDKLIG
jgi:(p)ppGpp synthase/HD superfamily hydrolase